MKGERAIKKAIHSVNLGKEEYFKFGDAKYCIKFWPNVTFSGQKVWAITDDREYHLRDCFSDTEYIVDELSVENVKKGIDKLIESRREAEHIHKDDLLFKSRCF